MAIVADMVCGQNCKLLLPLLADVKPPRLPSLVLVLVLVLKRKIDILINYTNCRFQITVIGGTLKSRASLVLGLSGYRYK